MSTSKHNNWFKDAIIYQLHVQSFYDSNDDGTGDFTGLTNKLPYLKSLGVNTLWLLPFYPSPLKDGGYDISDFTSIHPSYGKLSEFKKFVREAHKKDLRVVTELVLNHTSSQHKWFRRARESKPGTSYRNYYVWNDTPDKYQDARIIFQDFETSNWSWDPEAKAYYWHRFYSHQPDLNFDNPAVQKEMFRLIDFWFKIGVDGLRLDAVPYLYEREETNCENLPETHAFLKKLREYVDNNYADKMLLAEANQWPDDAREYFGDGNECHMAFHFPLMPRLYMAMRMEDRFPIIDILEQTPEIPDNCQWAIFLRNHDELTLEMVTDEERDYMYKSFVKEPQQRINLGIRRRLAPLMDNDRRKIEMMNILLFSLPGTPIVYYGDEIGMGDNFYLGDRHGVRTPMQWTADKNAGFSHTGPQRLFLPVIIDHEYHYEATNVESQEKNPSSLLWWMRRVIAVRKKYKAFNRGSIEFVNSNNPKVLSFIRKYEDEAILVIINLSRYSQAVELELDEYAGHTPVEVFSQNHFPVIEDDGYTFTLQYRDHFWLELTKQEEEMDYLGEGAFHQMAFSKKEWNTFSTDMGQKVKKACMKYMKSSRWFRGKAKKMKGLSIEDVFTLKKNECNTYLFFVEISYVASSSENYLLAGRLAFDEEEHEIRDDYPQAIIAETDVEGDNGILYDAMFSQEVHDLLLNNIFSRTKVKGRHGELVASPGKYLRKNLKKSELPLSSNLLAAEQSNTSILYDHRLFLKIYRSPDEGSNPELEIIRNLTEKTRFENLPPYAGTIDYQRPQKDDFSLAVLVGFIPNEGNAWELTETFTEQYFENILTQRHELTGPPDYIPDMLEDYKESEGKLIRDLTGYFFTEMVEKLGQRTAEMHLGLASIKDDKAFNPEVFSLLYQKSVNQSFRTLIKKTISELRAQKQGLEGSTKELCEKVLDNEKELLGVIKGLLESEKLRSQKTRVHGDYHLGQVLFTGKDFIIIDFEGEPARTLSARKLKYCPFKDVAGMLRSFHYAIYMAWFKFVNRSAENRDILEPWIEHWYHIVSYHFLKGYLDAASDAAFVPEKESQVESLLNLFLIEKAVYEASYEINNRPDWLVVPLNGLNRIIDDLVRE